VAHTATHPGHHTAGSPSQCVVLTPFQVSPSPLLLARFAERGVKPDICDDAIEAISRVALLDRLQQARAGWGLPPQGNILLMLDTAGACEDVALLRRAIDEHLRHVEVVEFDAQRPEACFVTLDRDRVDTERPASTVGTPEHPYRHCGEGRPAEAPTQPQPHLRLIPGESGAGGSTSSDPRRKSAQAAEPSSISTSVQSSHSERSDEQRDIAGGDEPVARRIVTREELAMLLDDDDDDAERPPDVPRHSAAGDAP